MKLGKDPYKKDPKTIRFGYLLDASYVIPSTFDFDKGRVGFPMNVWGNDKIGDCVMATRTNHLLRLERVETHRSVPITDQMVIDKYFQLTGGKDIGLNMLDTNRDWRNNGWNIPVAGKTRNYKIEAFGELYVKNPKQLRQGIYLMHGIQLGFALPQSAEAQTDKGYWDVTTGAGSEPGSWGGHAVYATAYDFSNLYVYSWGMKIRVTDAFVAKYADEAWVAVDSMDKWREALDVTELKKILHGIGAIHVEE